MDSGQLLKTHSLFRHLSSKEISELASHMQEISCPKDSIIFRENDESDKCYFIQSGEVAILSQKEIVAVLKTNDLLGETGVMLDTPRNATAKALTNCKLFYLDKKIILEFANSERENKVDLTQLIRSRSQIFHNVHIQLHKTLNTSGKNIYFLKHLINKEIFELTEKGFFIWQLIDGKKTFQHIKTLTLKQFPDTSPKSILRLLIELSELDFIKIKGHLGSTQELTSGKSKLIHFISKIPNLMEIFYDFNNVDSFITKTYPYIKWFFASLFQIFMAIIIFIGLICFFKLIPYSLSHLSLLHIKEFIILYIAFSFLLLFHELLHAYATKHFGYEVRAMGIGWFWLFPAAYCDTSDILLASKKERLIVNVIGIYFEAVISSMACIMGFLLNDPIWSSVCWLFALINYFNIIFNLNPAIDLDGYYIFQDLTEDLDLRENTLKWIIQKFPGPVSSHLKELIFSLWLLFYHVSIIPLLWWVQVSILSKFVPLFSNSSVSLILPFLIVGFSLMSVWSMIKLKE